MMELWQHLLMWLFGLLLLGSCVAYGIEWWKVRGFWKACRFFGTVFLTGLVLWIAIPDSIDRILGRYETTGGRVTSRKIRRGVAASRFGWKRRFITSNSSRTSRTDQGSPMIAK